MARLARRWDAPKLFALAAASRLALWVLALAFSFVVPDYDTSASLSLEPPRSAVDHVIKRLVGFLVKWDAVYFLRIAEHGYEFENFHAFFPGGPLMAKGLERTLLRPVSAAVSPQSALILGSFLLNNAMFIASAVLLYRVGLRALQNRSVALTAAVLFCVTPASIFMSAPFYTESPFMFFSLVGLVFLFEAQQGRRNPRAGSWLAAASFAACTAVRSNGTLYAGFLAYGALQDLFWTRRFRLWRSVWVVVRVVLQCMIVVAPYVAFQYYGWSLYCKPHEGAEQLPLRPWCAGRPPSLYGFVQDEYWNVGFLRYFTVLQLPNFALAAPMLVLSLSGIVAFIAHDPRRFFTAQLPFARSKMGRTVDGFYASRAAVFVYLWAFLWAVAFFVMHVQVATRFLGSLPSVYWWAAHLSLRAHDRHRAAKADARIRSGFPWHLAIRVYFLGYLVLGAALFPNFLPWT